MPENPVIQAIGTAVPPHKIPQELQYSILESANGLSRGEKLLLKKVYANSGIQSRYSVLEEFRDNDKPENVLFHPGGHAPVLPVSRRMELFETYALELSVLAIEDCLKQIPSLQPGEITHVITFSCTGMYAPGLDIQLVERLGLRRNVERTCINFMGCYAAINALKTAWHIARSQPDAVILLAGVELCTLHYQKSNKQDQMVANAIFADGAAAAIVSNKNFREPEKAGLQLNGFYSEFEPSGKDEMVWRIGDFGFDLRLSSYVPTLIRDNIYSFAGKLYAHAGIQPEEIDYYALHPGGMKILEACEHALKISKEQNKIAYDVLNEYGNMSSVTILFVLKNFFESFRSIDKTKKLLACAFGPGLTMESMIASVC